MSFIDSFQVLCSLSRQAQAQVRAAQSKALTEAKDAAAVAIAGVLSSAQQHQQQLCLPVVAFPAFLPPPSKPLSLDHVPGNVRNVPFSVDIVRYNYNYVF